MNDVHYRMLASREAFYLQNKNRLSKLDLWDVLGPTMPCLVRERLGEILDGGKWYDANQPNTVALGLLPINM